MDNQKIANAVYGLGLVGSGIGMWWIRYKNGKYIHYPTESSCELYNQDITKTPPSEIYGEEWAQNFKQISSNKTHHRNLIESGIKQIQAIIKGESNTCEYRIPWIDGLGNEIWLTDKAYLIDRNDDGTAKTIAGLTINESMRGSRRDHYQKLEEMNVKLRSVERRVIDLADFLVWSMNFNEFPNGDYLFCNESYRKAFGFDLNDDGYVKVEDFNNSYCDDDEGINTMNYLKEQYQLMVQNKINQYLRVLVKHKHSKTNKVFYLEHFTRVDERDQNGHLLRISGYCVDVTNQIKMERENEALERKNKDMLLAQKLAVDSGNVMIWFLNSETTPQTGYFYGNKILFDKLGLQRYDDNYFLITEFNDTIYIKDEEGKKLCKEYLELDDLVEANIIQSYSKQLVKHQNILTKEILYLEHNFVVEERYPDHSMKIRGGFINDITIETLYRKRIEFLVKHDLVTGLYNRNMFEEFTHSSNIPDQYTLMVIDIDGLKFINDAFGHNYGDEVIKILGRILKRSFAHDSTIYRIGGDEFTIITSDIEPNSIEQRIQSTKDLIVQDNDNAKLLFEISIGFEIVNDNNMDFNSAFISAENIMYRRKLGIRNSRKSRTMETVLATLNAKTEETKEHCERVGYFAVEIMKELGYTRTSDLDDIRLLCKVHDIGKITISEEILSKPDNLTKEEYKKIKTHSEAGFKIIKNIVESDLIANGVLHHHERYDGTGYPFGLAGEEIPLYAKIVAICDSYDVIVEGRPYQRKRSHKEAVEELVRCSGTQFDPKIVDVFVKLFGEGIPSIEK